MQPLIIITIIQRKFDFTEIPIIIDKLLEESNMSVVQVTLIPKAEREKTQDGETMYYLLALDCNSYLSTEVN